MDLDALELSGGDESAAASDKAHRINGEGLQFERRRLCSSFILFY